MLRDVHATCPPHIILLDLTALRLSLDEFKFAEWAY